MFLVLLYIGIVNQLGRCCPSPCTTPACFVTPGSFWCSLFTPPQLSKFLSLPTSLMPNSLSVHFLRMIEFSSSQHWLSHPSERSLLSACRTRRSRLRLSTRSVLHWRRQSRGCRGKWTTSWLTWRGRMQPVQHLIKSRRILTRFIQSACQIWTPLDIWKARPNSEIMKVLPSQ